MSNTNYHMKFVMKSPVVGVNLVKHRCNLPLYPKVVVTPNPNWLRSQTLSVNGEVRGQVVDESLPYGYNPASSPSTETFFGERKWLKKRP
jgi:hypothetical protein